MSNPNRTLIVTILDRSGSMKKIRSDMEGAFDAFIEAQRQEEGEAFVTLVRFDDRYETVYRVRPIADVPPLSLEPRGMTALHDAIGRTINSVGADLAKTTEVLRPGKVVVVIITDGLENDSKEFTADAVRSMIEHQTTKYSWVFTYLGANQDAVLVAQDLGISRVNTMTFAASSAGVRNSTRSMADAVSGYRRTGTYAGFSDTDRQEATAA